MKMPERSPSQRAADFGQVNLGYDSEQALSEAKRCLQCKKPLCVEGCPVGINIPGFVKAIAEGNPAGAVDILKDKNNLPAVCGRVCPQEEQCELRCVLKSKNDPIAIGNLERYSADWEKNNRPVPQAPAQSAKGTKKIAVIGSGPAGLTCAAVLAKKGFDITVFESLHKPGGVLSYGIPEFRLPHDILQYELKYLESIGVKFTLNCLVGRTKSLDDLRNEGFKAIFIGTGAGLPAMLNIPGENLNHIYSANEFLVRVNMMKANVFPEYDTPVFVGKRVVVIGGGNTAMDAARTALRLGAKEVFLSYRRSETEMPARAEEIRHAREEGVQLMLLTNPAKFIGTENGFVKAVELVNMELGEPDAKGRRKPVEKEGSNFNFECDMAVIAVGLNPNPVLASLTPGLETDARGRLKIDENSMTTLPGVFAGGDIVGGETVIQAMGMGKKAAAEIERYLASDTSQSCKKT